jgi:LPXTG-motif cell wall-anchored protein
LRNLLTKPLAALALAAALLLAPAAPALASPAAGVTAIKPGAFCKDAQLGQVGYSSDGDAYVCEKRNGERVGHWYGRHADNPAPKPKPTKTGTTGTGKTGSGGTGTGTSAKVENGNGTALPLTGDATPYQVGAGVAFVAVGGGLMLLARRRRRVRFQS